MGHHTRVLSGGGGGTRQGSPDGRVTPGVPRAAAAPGCGSGRHRSLGAPAGGVRTDPPPGDRRGGGHPGGPQPRARKEVPTGLEWAVPVCCFWGNWRCRGDTPMPPLSWGGGGASPTTCALRCLQVLGLPRDHPVPPQAPMSLDASSVPGVPSAGVFPVRRLGSSSQHSCARQKLHSHSCRGWLCRGGTAFGVLNQPGGSQAEMSQQNPAPVPCKMSSRQNSVS